jgi:hypothetical protein
MSNKTLEITNEIHQAWIDAEKQMTNFDGDDHAAVVCHNYIGKALYGEDLEGVKAIIYDNSNEDITAEFINNKLTKSKE